MTGGVDAAGGPPAAAGAAALGSSHRVDSADATDASVDPAFGPLRDRAIDLLTGWDAPDAEQEDLRRAYLEHLATYPAACAKAGPPGHLTASALVVDASGSATALVYHGKGRRWFQPGGHLEPVDADLVAGALREAQEETGLSGLRIDPVPLRLDRHGLGDAFGRCREHLDVQFLVLAQAIAPAPDGSAGATPGDPRVCVVVSPESIDVRWWSLDAIPDVEAVGDLVDAARTRLRTADR